MKLREAELLARSLIPEGTPLPVPLDPTSDEAWATRRTLRERACSILEIPFNEMRADDLLSITTCRDREAWLNLGFNEVAWYWSISTEDDSWCILWGEGLHAFKKAMNARKRQKGMLESVAEQDSFGSARNDTEINNTTNFSHNLRHVLSDIDILSDFTEDDIPF